MTTSAPSRLISADEFLEMPQNRGAELVDGRIVEKNVGNESSWVGAELIFFIRLYLQSHKIGRVFSSENGLKIWPNRPRQLRKPDVTFVRSGRLPGNRPVKGWQEVAPDLVVEVVSPKDRAEDLEQKLDEYRDAGIELIWVIYPSVRSAQVLTRDGRMELGPDGVLDGGEVLPGFTLSLRELFAGLED